ncbi:MAG: hypothetical protein K1X67_19615 [Fimbriimonadaceae bacterium]|nr:hypothetical protein [Fimbriimonadaceae bacterium]
MFLYEKWIRCISFDGTSAVIIYPTNETSVLVEPALRGCHLVDYAY